MKFRSPTAEPVTLILGSGHSCNIGPEFEELPDIFVNDTLARGCVADRSIAEGNNAKVQAGPDAVNQDTPEQSYRKAFVVMLERNEEGDFTADGLPNTNSVSKLVGFRANKEDLLAEFRQMQIEAESQAGE